MRYLSLLTNMQIIRLANRLYARIPCDHYGWDWHTLWHNNPGLARDFRTVLEEYNKRKMSAQIGR